MKTNKAPIPYYFDERDRYHFLADKSSEVSVSFFPSGDITIWVGKLGKRSTYRIDINLKRDTLYVDRFSRKKR